MFTKKEVEIERLLKWAFRDELSKRITSSAEGIWDRLAEIGQRGGIDPGHGAAQRYAHFGLPHDDALAIDKAVDTLPDLAIDWEADVGNILGDLAALAGERTSKPTKAAARPSKAGWTLGDGRMAHELVEPARQVIQAHALATGCLVAMHAKLGTRPDWREDPPEPQPITQGSRITIVGACWGKNVYKTGSYCPIEWSPTIKAIAEARIDYLAWWRGLSILATTLQLRDHIALPPTAPKFPWFEDNPVNPPNILQYPSLTAAKLPLKPQRETAGTRNWRTKA